MRIPFSLAAASMLAACVNTTADVTSKSEGEEIGDVQHQLSVRLEEKFGKGARVQQIFGKGDEVVIGVALEAVHEESDARPPLALAGYRPKEDVLSVLAQAAEYKEAKLLPAGLALVTTLGELKLRKSDGTEQTVAEQIKGEVAPAPDGRLLATLEGGTRPMGDSAVLLADASGKTAVIADAEGVDDRPSVSPDNKTVVFVSGRSGVASLWRTTLDGAEPEQITNKGIEVGIERTGEPEGFVPPPVMADRLEWVSADVVRYDAGDGDYWSVNVRTGEATREGGAK